MLPEEKYFKLWSEKCKILCYINHYILVTMVTKWTLWPPLFLLKFASGTLKESLYQIWGKFMEWKLCDRILRFFSNFCKTVCLISLQRKQSGNCYIGIINKKFWKGEKEIPSLKPLICMNFESIEHSLQSWEMTSWQSVQYKTTKDLTSVHTRSLVWKTEDQNQAFILT